MKSIQVTNDVWKILQTHKINNNYRSIEQVIKELLDDKEMQ